VDRMDTPSPSQGFAMITILYVDDEPPLLEIAKEFLESDGDVEVETSSSAMDALVRIEIRHFDAIISDYQMPEVDGIKFLKTLRMQGRTTPFILFTGKGREDVAIEALNNGADFYLQKGGNPKAQFTELLNMIRRSIEQRQSAERLKESEEIYEKLFKDNVEAMVLVDPKTGAIADVNTAATNFFGYSREEMLRMNIADTYPGHDKRALEQFGQKEVEKGAKTVMPNRLANGETREVEVDSGMLRVKGRSLGYSIIHDITEVRRAQRREQRLGRALKVLSATSRLILRSQNEMELLDGISRALVEHGGYLHAWIGVFDVEMGTVRELVRASRSSNSNEGDNPLDLQATIDLAMQVKESSDIVVRKPANVGVQSSTKNEPSRALAALPLRLKDSVRAAMVIASDDVEAMEEGEIALLQELAESLSEAITIMAARESVSPTTEEGQGQSDALLKELLGSALDVIVKMDQDGTLVYVSPAVKNLLGIEPEEMMGRNLMDYVHPEDLEPLQQNLQGALPDQDQVTVRLRLRKGDGYIVVEAIGRVLRDEEGEPKSLVGSVRDITSRQMAEERLWETGSKLRAIIQTSPMAIISLDSNGIINTWNPAAEKVFGLGNVDSAHPFSFLPDKDTEELRRLRSIILAGETLSDVELHRKAQDGSERRISLSTAPILDQAGKVTSIILVASDITERKAMEERLIQLNDLLRLVNRILRHDTLNELMVVAGSLDMFHKTKQERFLITATKAVNRSMEMIKRMKELESLAASGGAMKIYDLRQSVEKVLRGYMVEFSVEGEGSIFADDALASAIDNVVRNAMVHGKADRIDARIWVKDGRCYLRIADNGIGIPDHIKNRLFEEGFSYGANAGTGLGLYLVTRAVARYGGYVSVEDNEPKGAAFLFEFPEAKTQVQTA
jgi:PAS domain S-box-containing protein